MHIKHIVAIGAHPGDMEISCGAVLAAHRARGNKVTIVHLTNSPKYSSRKSNKLYFYQTQLEAEEAAITINAGVIANVIDYNLFDMNPGNASLISNLIIRLKPTTVITHWKNSIERDHIITHQLVCQAMEQYGENNCSTENSSSLYFSEHPEDRLDFEPIIYVDISNYMGIWEKMVKCYQHFSHTNKSQFQYLSYFEALAKIRGNESYCNYACGFNSFPNNYYSNDILP